MGTDLGDFNLFQVGGPAEGPGVGGGWVIGLGTDDDFVAVLAGVLGTGAGTHF